MKRLLVSTMILASLCAAPAALAGTKTFNGNTPAWHIGGNWTPSGVPEATDDVVIPIGEDCVLGNTAGACLTLSIRDHATLTIEGVRLTLGEANNPTTSTIDGDVGIAPVPGVLYLKWVDDAEAELRVLNTVTFAPYEDSGGYIDGSKVNGSSYGGMVTRSTNNDTIKIEDNIYAIGSIRFQSNVTLADNGQCQVRHQDDVMEFGVGDPGDMTAPTIAGTGFPDAGIYTEAGKIEFYAVFFDDTTPTWNCTVAGEIEVRSEPSASYFDGIPVDIFLEGSGLLDFDHDFCSTGFLKTHGSDFASCFIEVAYGVLVEFD